MKGSQLTLFHPADASVELEAYLSSALTGLDKEQRSLIFQICDLIAQVCEKHDISLYEPSKHTDPVYHRDLADTQVFRINRERVLASDLLIHLTHFPGTVVQ